MLPMQCGPERKPKGSAANNKCACCNNSALR